MTWSQQYRENYYPCKLQRRSCFTPFRSNPKCQPNQEFLVSIVGWGAESRESRIGRRQPRTVQLSIVSFQPKKKRRQWILQPLLSVSQTVWLSEVKYSCPVTKHKIWHYWGPFHDR